VTICRRETRLLRYGILNLGVSLHLVPEAGAQEARRVEINGTSKYSGQLILHPKEGQTRQVARLEFHQNIHIAVRPEIRTQSRARDRETSDMMSFAELCKPLLRNFQITVHNRGILCREIPDFKVEANCPRKRPVSGGGFTSPIRAAPQALP
jgi:hypothetical protein